MYKQIGLVSGIKLVSKLSGLFRDRMIAVFIGVTALSDSFFLAFNSCNSLKNVVGDEAIKASFLPAFTKSYESENREECWRMVNTLFNAFILFLLIFTGVIYLFAPMLMRLIGIGFHIQHQFIVTVTIFKLLLPFILFSSLATVFYCILTSLRQFAIPASLPLLLNMCMASSTLLLSAKLGIYALVWGVIIGGGIQFIIQLPQLYGQGYRYQFIVDFSHPALKKIVKRMVPVIISSSILQSTILIDTSFASTLTEGSISYLYYSNKLMLVPYDIFGLALSMVIFPEFARLSLKSDNIKIMESFEAALRFLFFFGLPTSIGMMLLGKPIVAVIYGVKTFDATAIQGISTTLIYYTIGLIGFMSIRIINPLFYSFNDTRTPMLVGLLCLVLNIIFDVILIRYLSYGGLALSSSIVVFINVIIMIVIIQTRFFKIRIYSISVSLIQSSVGVLVMVGIYFIILHQFNSNMNPYVFLLLSTVLCLISYILTMTLLKNKELKYIYALMVK